MFSTSWNLRGANKLLLFETSEEKEKGTMERKEEEEEEGKNRLQSYSPAALLGWTSASIRMFAAFSLFRKKVVMVLMLLKF